MLGVYYSGASNYTHRFMQKVGGRLIRIPLHPDDTIQVEEPFVLVLPTYGSKKRKVPPQVVKFLNVEQNRKNLRGVIGTGNTNFNAEYCIAAEIVARKCDVPVLHRLELLGMPEDVQVVQNILGEMTT